LTTHTQQTVLAAFHLALLCTYPLSSSITPTINNIRHLITLEYNTDADVLKWTYWGAIGTLLGAWLGAVPIPLDWDREWQVLPLIFCLWEKWPITIVVGAYCGHAFGILMGLAWHGVSTKGPKSVVQLESIEEEKKVL
jgi:phosphatidylinositol glycan class F